MYIYNDLINKRWIVVDHMIDNKDLVFVRKVRKIQINHDEIVCNVYFISEDNESDGVLVVT